MERIITTSHKEIDIAFISSDKMIIVYLKDGFGYRTSNNKASQFFYAKTKKDIAMEMQYVVAD